MEDLKVLEHMSSLREELLQRKEKEDKRINNQINKQTNGLNTILNVSIALLLNLGI